MPVTEQEFRERTAYTALIRTQDSLPRVAQTIASLRAQSCSPTAIVAVDASRTAEEKASLARLVDVVVAYPDEPFNYSKAINLGVAQCVTPDVLIISAHVILNDTRLVERGVEAARRHDVLGFYLQTSPDESWAETPIDRSNFNCRNGLSNTCAFLPTRRIVERPFREEVFSAEDQEWAAHQFRTGDGRILRIRTSELIYENPKWNEMKYINEEVSIAYFTCREKLGASHILSRLTKCAVAVSRGRWLRARTEWTILRSLLAARSAPPLRTSRYF